MALIVVGVLSWLAPSSTLWPLFWCREYYGYLPFLLWPDTKQRQDIAGALSAAALQSDRQTWPMTMGTECFTKYCNKVRFVGTCCFLHPTVGCHIYFECAYGTKLLAEYIKEISCRTSANNYPVMNLKYI